MISFQDGCKNTDERNFGFLYNFQLPIDQPEMYNKPSPNPKRETEMQEINKETQNCVPRVICLFVLIVINCRLLGNGLCLRTDLTGKHKLDEKHCIASHVYQNGPK